MRQDTAFLTVLLCVVVIYASWLHVKMNRRVQTALNRHNALQLLSLQTTRKMETQPPDVRISSSPVQGNGVFAARDFEEGELIERCPLLFLRRDGATSIVNYTFNDPQDANQCFFALGYGSLYNHDENPNATTRIAPSANALDILARQRIPKGTEITFSYGPKYWEFQKMLQRLRSQVG